jgi:hypothetical protein
MTQPFVKDIGEDLSQEADCADGQQVVVGLPRRRANLRCHVSVRRYSRSLLAQDSS